MTTKNKQDKALTHGGTLERTFGSTATTRITDFLRIHRETDHSKQDIAKYSDVSMKHALITIEKLEKFGIIKKTRNVGHNHMYQYNIENPISKAIWKLAHEISVAESEKLTEADLWHKETEKQKQTQEKVMVTVPT